MKQFDRTEVNEHILANWHLIESEQFKDGSSVNVYKTAPATYRVVAWDTHDNPIISEQFKTHGQAGKIYNNAVVKPAEEWTLWEYVEYDYPDISVFALGAGEQWY